MRLAWPEKVAIAAALVVPAAMLLFWALIAEGIGSTHDTRLNVAVIQWFAESEVVLVFPLWLLLRTIHFISHGWHHWRSGH